MNLLIAGSRSYEHPKKSGYPRCECGKRVKTHIKEYLEDLFLQVYGDKFTVIHGGARAVDTWAGLFALDRDFNVDKYPADWDRYGKRAGFLRNKEMVTEADAAAIWWDGESKGTRHTIGLCTTKGIPIDLFIRPHREECFIKNDHSTND